MTKFLALVMLAFVPLFFAAAKPGDAPGIKKKTVEIYNISISTTATTATISWETNVRAEGSVFIEDFGILAEKKGTRHFVTLPFLVPDHVYEYTITAFSDLYGAATPEVGVFSL